MELININFNKTEDEEKFYQANIYSEAKKKVSDIWESLNSIEKKVLSEISLDHRKELVFTGGSTDCEPGDCSGADCDPPDCSGADCEPGDCSGADCVSGIV